MQLLDSDNLSAVWELDDQQCCLLHILECGIAGSRPAATRTTTSTFLQEFWNWFTPCVMEAMHMVTLEIRSFAKEWADRKLGVRWKGHDKLQAALMKVFDGLALWVSQILFGLLPSMVKRPKRSGILLVQNLFQGRYS